MKPYPYYQVNAFSNSVYGGNPAGVCPLTAWLPTDVMQQLAAENNLSETAFFVPREDGSFDIRWFTPEFEIDLAGHPTLATAWVIFNYLAFNGIQIVFHSKSGPLYVTKKQHLLEMDFPSRMPVDKEVPLALKEGIVGKTPLAVFKSRDWVLQFENAADVANIEVDYTWLNKLEDTVGIIATAPGNDCDFVSRFFVPNSVIGEDPVTGSAHATLVPFWAEKLGKTSLLAKQISKRGGVLYCESKGDRVKIAGECVLYLKGEYYLYE
ncbi:MAG: PhzF family phenazine biosynthesis protein [Chitinophagaceae bacterium]